MQGGFDSIAAGVPDAARLLSPRQKECLRLVYNRKTTKEIAALLGLSPGTVSTYCTEAIRALGARDRRDAAERLHAWEADSGTVLVPDIPPPSEMQSPSEGVAERPRTPAVIDAAVPSWARLLPFRYKDAPGNDLSVLARLLWIPVLAAVCAIGFGAVADGLRVVSDFVRSISGGHH